MIFRPKIFEVSADLIPTLEEIEKLDIYLLTINKEKRKRPTMTFEFTEKNNRVVLSNHTKMIYHKKDDDIIIGGKKILKKLAEIKGI